MFIVEIVFWILLGLLYLGFTVRFMEIIIGFCALVIGVVKLVEWLRSR